MGWSFASFQFQDSLRDWIEKHEIWNMKHKKYEKYENVNRMYKKKAMKDQYKTFNIQKER